MHSLALFVESLIAPHVQVLAGIEHYRSQHGLDWVASALVQGAAIPAPHAGISYLAIHRRMIPESIRSNPQGPVLGLFGPSDDLFHGCITLQQEAFGQLAGQYLHEQGLRSIAWLPSARAEGRKNFTGYYQGLQRACKRLDIHLDELPPGDPNGDIALRAALRQHIKPFGVYCATDAQAAWLLDRCQEEGLRVPNDIALLGTSDHPHHCERRRPTISSIAFPWFLMGRTLGLAAHQQLSGVARPEPQDLRPLRVVERDSTTRTHSSDPLITASLNWLERHLQEAQPLAACAAAQQCSVPTLSRRFRRVLGSSVKQVHACLRHREAMRLLRCSNASIAAIAKSCGYADAAAMSVAFKRQSGWSPGRWRMAAKT